MLSWLIAPTDSFSASAELWSDVWLFVCTFLALAFISAEYAAEHLEWPWGKARKHIFAIWVIVAFAGELIFESASFWFSYQLQSSQADQIRRTEAEIAPRRLTMPQMDLISSSTWPPPDKAVRVTSYALDTEAAILGWQIVSALKNGGVTVDDCRMSQGTLGAITIGVHVTGSDKTEVKRLLAILAAVGLSPSKEPLVLGVGMSSGCNTPDNEIAATVFVGVKPLPQ